MQYRKIVELWTIAHIAAQKIRRVRMQVKVVARFCLIVLRSFDEVTFYDTSFVNEVLLVLHNAHG